MDGRRFRDRADAGRELAPQLTSYAGQPDVVVLGLARGGVPVAAEVAVGLSVPLDVFVVRKLGVEGRAELAMGAIASGGVRVLNPSVIQGLAIGDDEIERVAARERRELERRTLLYRDGRPAPDLAGKVVIVVDDGLATGSTMRAAVAALRQLGPRRIVVAVPVGSPVTCGELREEADEVVCLRTPHHFSAVGEWYRDFAPTTDDQVAGALRSAPGGV
jgi:predicted phosphoribosyltransferase